MHHSIIPVLIVFTMFMGMIVLTLRWEDRKQWNKLMDQIFLSKGEKMLRKLEQ